MFVKPTGSKAIRIVKPPDEEEKSNNGTDRSSWTTLPHFHNVAIQQAVNAIRSLPIGSRTTNAQVPVSDPVGGMNTMNKNPMIVRVTEDQKNALSPTDDNVQEDCEPGFNIYARPFIPEVCTVINDLPGHQISTSPRSTINFDDYSYRSFGPATGFLPQPLPVGSSNMTSTFTEASSIGPQYYEAFFQFHLYQEVQAQRVENNTYSRK